MAIPYVLPTEDEAEEAQGQQLEQLMLDLYAALQQVLRSRSAQHPSRNHRLPRRSGDISGSREHPVILVDSDLSRLPLPDLVLSAVEQLPPPTPQVTVSAPSSPTRDAAFQFPECSSSSSSSSNSSNNSSSISNNNVSNASNGNISTDSNGNISNSACIPVPSPRPRPRRRRLTSDSSMEKGPLPNETTCSGNACCYHLGQSLNERQWASVGTNLRNIADDFHASMTKNAEMEKSRLPLLGPGFTSPSAAAPSSTDSILSLLIPAPLRETLWTTVALYLGWRLVSRLR